MILYNPKKKKYLDTDDGVSDLETITTVVQKYKQPEIDNRILTAESLNTTSVQNLIDSINNTNAEDLPRFNEVFKNLNVDIKIDGRTTNISLVKKLKKNDKVKNLLDSIDE